MSVSVHWHPQLPDTICFELQAGWHWREYEAGITAFYQLIRSVRRPVNVLVHLAGDAAFAISPLVQARHHLDDPSAIQAIRIAYSQGHRRSMLDLFIKAYQDLGEPIEVLGAASDAPRKLLTGPLKGFPA